MQSTATEGEKYSEGGETYTVCRCELWVKVGEYKPQVTAVRCMKRNAMTSWRAFVSKSDTVEQGEKPRLRL